MGQRCWGGPVGLPVLWGAPQLSSLVYNLCLIQGITYKYRVGLERTASMGCREVVGPAWGW